MAKFDAAGLVRSDREEKMGRPSLSLPKEPDTEGGFHLFHDPLKEDQWTIFFRTKIDNVGDSRAQNWRVWFSPLDDSTWILFDTTVARVEAYRKDKLTGRCETILDERTRVSDFCIEPHEVRSIPGRHFNCIHGQAVLYRCPVQIGCGQYGNRVLGVADHH